MEAHKYHQFLESNVGKNILVHGIKAGEGAIHITEQLLQHKYCVLYASKMRIGELLLCVRNAQRLPVGINTIIIENAQMNEPDFINEIESFIKYSTRNIIILNHEEYINSVALAAVIDEKFTVIKW